MRRTEKKAIFEMLDTISEAHIEYRKHKNDKEGEDILAACQECAISIGNAIEKSEGEGTESVSLLEKYCEDLYQLNQGQKGISLDTDLINIRNKISSEIKVVLEVVFFPYKASMWDSMESIYLSFQKCDNVNVYLVPIPYYNRNNDGTVETVHCESELFPEGEAVTDWKAFDIERIKPDIAFIHNPYDDMNFVTTVDPRFYSYELKKNVECLVYCPYYSTVGAVPKAQSLCKAYLYSDYILTQSEYQLEFYDKSIPVNKFLPMGSPKFDKAIRLNNERKENPDSFYAKVSKEWIEKSKGKKVYFYNTSITWLLFNTPLFLDKMKYVFDSFARHRDVAVLFWRPHPLLEDTLNALRPEFKERYEGLKRKFLDENIGILDETPDISIAVAFCDAFIGDTSTSVTSLFNVTGKPIYALNNGIIKEPTAHDIIDRYFQIPVQKIQGGYIVTPGNQVYKCDYPFTNPIKFRYITTVSEYSTQMYTYCAAYKDKVFIAPDYAEKIKVYNSDGKLSEIKLKHCTNQAYKFFSAHVYKEHLFLIPDEYSYIVRLDMDTQKVTYTEDLRDIFITEDQNYDRYCGGVAFFGNELLIGSQANNKLLAIDIDTLGHRIIKVGEDADAGCYKIISDVNNNDADSVFILPYKGNTVRRFYPNNSNVIDYEINIDGLYCSDMKSQNYHDDLEPFSSLVVNNDTIYLAPFRSNKYVKIDLNSGEASELVFSFTSDRFDIDTYNCKFFSYKDKYYWISYKMKRLYEVKFTGNICEVMNEIPVEFDIDEVRYNSHGFTVESPWWREYSLVEDAVNSLSSIILGDICGSQFDKQKELDSLRDVAANLDGTCGQHICDFLINKMEI